MMKARGWIAVGAAAVIAISAGVAVVALRPSESGGDDAAGASSARRSTASAIADATPVCGFPGSLVSAIVADGSEELPERSFRSWDALDPDLSTTSIDATGDGLTLTMSEDDRTVVKSFGRDGAAQGSTAHDFDGYSAIGQDRSVYYISNDDDGNRLLVRDSADGAEQWRVAVPAVEDDGLLTDVTGLVWVSSLQGAPAILVAQGGRTVHAFGEDGTALGIQKGLPGVLSGAEGSIVFGTRPAGADAAAIVGLDVSNSSEVLHAVSRTSEVKDPDVTETPRVDGETPIVTGPGGDGFLVMQSPGIVWIDRFGVRRAAWTDGGDGLSLSTERAITHRDGTYWLVGSIEEKSRVIALTDAEMLELLHTPVDLSSVNEPELAQLGIGIGPTTGVRFNHFDAGTDPRVTLHAERGWGESPDADASGYELRYSVRGDPKLATTVEPVEETADLPIGGGDVDLVLPEVRPGPYEVSLALVDRSTGEPISGSCLRYSVGAEDAPLDFASLSGTGDWGGPGPLRGVELADRLGIDSHRIQLYFGLLVPDPTVPPSAAAIDWTGLPGSASVEEDATPAQILKAGFDEIRQAASYAAAHDITLAVQFGAGGDAEASAVEAGTWGEWIRLIVSEFAAQAPQITTWEAWNEPNNTFGDAADFATTVEIPFADAVHAAQPGGQVIGGNTLGLSEDWWEGAVAAGVCSHLDAVGVHPYTGWNRSWEEDGYTAEGAGFESLRAALGPECGKLPIWDTETGWWGDGEASYWAQGSDVSRKLLWYSNEHIAGWTYFFSEGAWGESNMSWSLIQLNGYVKPGGLAMAAVSRIIEGRGPAEVIETGIPNTYAMRLPGDGDLVAVWTDDMRIDARVSANAQSLGVVDQYGAHDTIPLDAGSATVALSGTPRFFSAPEGTQIDIGPVEAFGPDLLLDRPATASSTLADTDAQVVTSGTVNPYRSWRSGTLKGGAIDEHPSIEVSFAAPTAIDRIAVASTSLTCCETTLRDYTVSVKGADGKWVVVAEQHDQFFDRVVLFHFDDIVASAVKVEVPWTTIRDVKVLDVNYAGTAGGLPPPFMGLQTGSEFAVSVAAIQAWAPAE